MTNGVRTIRGLLLWPVLNWNIDQVIASWYKYPACPTRRRS